MATQSLLDGEGRWVWEEVKKEEHNQNALYEILKELITVTISRVQNKLSKNLEDLVFCYCFLGSWLHTGSPYFYYPGTRWSAKPRDASCLQCVRWWQQDGGFRCNQDSSYSHPEPAVGTAGRMEILWAPWLLGCSGEGHRYSQGSLLKSFLCLLSRPRPIFSLMFSAVQRLVQPLGGSWLVLWTAQTLCLP